MTAKVLSDEDFLREIERLGPAAMGRKHGISVRGIFGRRANLEKQLGRQIVVPEPEGGHTTRVGAAHPGRLDTRIGTGVALIGSDCHYWNTAPSTAHRAFVKFCKDLAPKVVVLNGDVLDGASISRHPPINWEERPSLIQEIEACQERTGEIERAAGKAEKYWSLGNHDGRFETRLATVAPEYARIHGVHLKDHFNFWEPCWSIWINDVVVVKHRFKGGIHATHNNTLWAGKSTVTGHLHSLKVTPLTDYNGTRFGVDSGTMADPWGPQFEYMEDNPRNWRAGFIVLTFRDGRLMWPEVCHVIGEDAVEFRGEIVKV